MQRIKITLDNPIIGENQKIRHHATSYQISRSKNFEDEDKLLINNLKDEVNKLEFYADLDVDETDILYTRTKFHFKGDDDTDHESNWSRITPAYANQTGIKISSSVVGTPNVTADLEDGLLTMKTSDFNMYAGPGQHHSTDYMITTTDNEVLYTRENDTDNLTSIYINSILQNGKIYSIMARHQNNTNNLSNYGKRLFANYVPDHLLFKFESPTPFVIQRRYYYRIKIWVTNFLSYDLQIRDKDDNVILEIKDESRVTHSLIAGYDKFAVNGTYFFYLRLNFRDNTSTEFKLVNKEQLLVNNLTYFNSNVEYPDKYKNSLPIKLGNINCLTTRETFDNRVISLDPQNNKLNLYSVVNNDLQFVDTLFDLDSTEALKGTTISYLNVLQLYTGDILVDAVVYKANRKPWTVFLLFEYNPIKIEMVLLGQLIRTDEKYCTSVSNSLAVAKNGFVYYIPAYLTNGRSQERKKLVLRKLDIDKLSKPEEPNTIKNLITEIELPFVAKGHVTITPDRNGTLYILGGSNVASYTKDSNGRNTETWINDNRKVYQLDHNTDVLTEWCPLPDYLPKAVYCLQPFLRLDGKVILFNGTWSGPGLEYDKFITFEPDILTFNEYPINGRITVPMRSNIVFQDGVIKRIASKTTDVSEQDGNTIPSSTVEYLNVKGTAKIPDITPLVYDSLDIVVNDGEIMNIEDIYRYTSFDIKPGGILRWHRPQGVLELGSKDLIVHKDMDITMEELNRNEYNSILVLQGVDFRILTGKPRSEDVDVAI